MYVIIGSHFVPLEAKFLLIALVIVRITLNVIVCQNAPKSLLNNSVSIVQKFVVKLLNTTTTFSHQVEITVEVLESLTTSFFELWTIV